MSRRLLHKIPLLVKGYTVLGTGYKCGNSVHFMQLCTCSGNRVQISLREQCTKMCKIMSNRLRESVPTGRGKLQHGNRVPIIHNFLQLSTLFLHLYPVPGAVYSVPEDLFVPFSWNWDLCSSLQVPAPIVTLEPKESV